MSLRGGDSWERKFEVFGRIFLERKFWMFERILRDWRKFWEEENTKKKDNFEDDGSLKLGVIITNSFIDQHKSRVHPRQRASKSELSVCIYSFICGFSRKLAQNCIHFLHFSFLHIFMSGKWQLQVNGKSYGGVNTKREHSTRAWGINQAWIAKSGYPWN